MVLNIGTVSLKNHCILAPLADITDYPFREVVRRLGGELTYTEMIASKAICHKNPKTLHMAKPVSGEYPLTCQIVGSDPSEMAQAAKICEDLGAAIIDINMGCPQKKIVKTGAGAALLLDIKRAEDIVSKIKKAVSVPVTCKTRLGWDSKSICILEFSLRLQEAGASMIAIHARTKKQMFSGVARWDLIKPVTEKLEIPVIVNGDIKGPEDAKRALKESGAHGVMIGRASLGRPWIIGKISYYLREGKKSEEPNTDEKKKIIDLHLLLLRKFYDEKNALLKAKKHLSWYTKGMKFSASFRNRLQAIKNFNELLKFKDEFFKRHN